MSVRLRDSVHACVRVYIHVLYWNGQLVWTPALGLYTGMDN